MISGGSHPLDEQEIEQLRAALAEANEQIRLLKVQQKERLRDYKASVKQIAGQLDEASRRREEDGRHLLKLFKDREWMSAELAWVRGQVQTLRGLCEGIERADGYDPETAYVTVREIRRIVDMEPAATSTGACVPRVTDWNMPAQVVQLQCLENVERCATEGCTNAKTGWGVCEPVEAAPQPSVDAELADINARVEADKRALTGEQTGTEPDDICAQCGHRAHFHQADGCWYVSVSAGRDVSCPCSLVRESAS